VVKPVGVAVEPSNKQRAAAATVTKRVLNFIMLSKERERKRMRNNREMLNGPALFYIVLLLLYTHTHTTDLNFYETAKEGLSFTTIQGQIH